MDRHAAVDRIILACDGLDDVDELLWVLRALKDYVGGAKLGLEMLLEHGRSIIDRVRDETGLEIMADPKLPDIGATNAKALKRLLKSKPRFVTIKIDTGTASLKQCVEICGESGTEMVGITVLTSIADECKIIYGDEVPEKVEQFAGMFVECGGRVIVCSPQETALLMSRFPNLRVLNPGVRPPEGDMDDQQRVGTPKIALDAKAHRLIVGRPILKSWMEKLQRARNDAGVAHLRAQADLIIENAMLSEAA